MPLTTAPDVFVSTPPADIVQLKRSERHRWRRGMKQLGRKTLQRETNAQAKWQSERGKTLPGASVNTSGAAAFRLLLASMLNKICSTLTLVSHQKANFRHFLKWQIFVLCHDSSLVKLLSKGDPPPHPTSPVDNGDRRDMPAPRHSSGTRQQPGVLREAHVKAESPLKPET